jgi:hypothetical protein
VLVGGGVDVAAAVAPGADETGLRAGEPLAIADELGAGEPLEADEELGAGEPLATADEGAGEPLEPDVELGAGEPLEPDVELGAGEPLEPAVGDALEVTTSTGRVIVFASSVTAPLRARARPFRVTPVVRVMDEKARIVPWKCEPVPSVAELPTTKNTLAACAPLIRVTWLPDAVVSVDGALKMKTALELPRPSSVRVPVRPNDPPEA